MVRCRCIPAAATVLALAGLSAGCGHERAVERALTPVRAQTVGAHSGAGGVRYSATIEPYQQVSLAFKVPGYIDRILTRPGADGHPRPAQAGDAVSRGTVLAHVDSADYEQQVSQARASQEAARVSRDKAKIDLDRATALFESRSLTRADLDSAKSSYDASAARLSGAEAQRRQAESLLADCALRAPLDGVLLERRIEVGSLVASGTAGFVLADLTRVKARFGVPDIIVDTLEPGDVLTLTADALMGREFTGRVTAVSPSADERNRVFDVEVTVPNPRNELKAGMIATVRVGGLSAPPVPVVPLSAIVRPPGSAEGYAVFAVEGEGETFTARARRVTLGEVYGNQIVVTSGLGPGERVIVGGATLVADGERVRIVP